MIEIKDLLKSIEQLYNEGYTYLVKITAVDYIKTINVIYILRSFNKNEDKILEAELDPANPSVETIIHIYEGADWYERELHEMFGIKINGRHVKKLILEKWDGKGYPLRKNFEWGKPYEKE
ncbi:MAG: NADH-quinone oxidoreductase subunit C [Candidatus Micrarchaeaceae archaeon]